jgi:Na+/melibiose symporter-like transporter
MGFLPAALVLVAAAFIMRFPLDKRRHDIIRKRLELLSDRRAREQAAKEQRASQEVGGTIEMRPSATH